MKPLNPKSEIQKACLLGVKTAYDKYYEWTGGLSLDHAPESFIQSEIANSLSTVSRYVTLEDGVRDTLISAGASIKGKMPRNGRLDIVTWWEAGTPRKYIEVKKAFRNSAIAADAKRLRQMVNRGGSIRKGLIVVYTSAMRSDTLLNRIETMAALSGTVLLCNLGPQRSTLPGGSVPWFWDAACFNCE